MFEKFELIYRKTNRTLVFFMPIDYFNICVKIFMTKQNKGENNEYYTINKTYNLYGSKW